MLKKGAIAVLGVTALLLQTAVIIPSAIALLIVIIPSPEVLNIAVFAAAVLISLLAQALSVQQIILLAF